MVLQPLVTSLFSGLGRGELGFKKSSAPSLSVPDTPKLCAPPPGFARLGVCLFPGWGLGKKRRQGVSGNWVWSWEVWAAPVPLSSLSRSSCSLELAASERWKIRADGARSCAFLFATQDPHLFLTRQGWSSTGPAGPSESCSASGVASASALLLSRLCVPYLCILVSQRLPLSVSVTVSFSSPFCCWLQLT